MSSGSSNSSPSSRSSQSSVSFSSINAFCGDGRQDRGEQCGEPGLSCPQGQTCNSTSCLCSGGGLCGNGTINQGEQCGEPGLICPQDQTCEAGWCLCQGAVTCGNGSADRGEQCGEPGLSCPQGQICGQNTCLCTGGPYCGDGNINRGELCGEPGLSCAPGQTCNPTNCLCVSPANLFFICGDGKKDPGEECDDGNNRDEDGCGSLCLVEAGFCGDAIVQKGLGEQCEPSTFDRSLSFICGPDCRFHSFTCGDGRVDAGEECDEGLRNSDGPNAHCRTNCSFARCGDATLDTVTEQCDDGNKLGGDGCDKFCLIQPTAAPGQVLGAAVPLQYTPLPGEVLPAQLGTTTDGTLGQNGAQGTQDGRPLVMPKGPNAPRTPVAVGTPVPNAPQLHYDENGEVVDKNGNPVAREKVIQMQDETIKSQRIVAGQRTPKGDLNASGPAAVAVMAAGAAGGYAWTRKRRR